MKEVDGVGDQRHAPAALPSREWIPVLTEKEAGWVPGPVWTGAEILAPHPQNGFDPRTAQPVASRSFIYSKICIKCKWSECPKIDPCLSFL